MNISVIIVNYNTKKLLIECIDLVYKYTKNITYEIIIVDNNSKDGSILALKKFILDKKDLNIRIIENKDNKGFGSANNQGMKIAKGKYIFLLNSDTKFLENSLEKLFNWMENHPKVGASSCRIINPPDVLQANGGNFPDLFRVFLWQTFISDIPGITNIFGSYHYTPAIPLIKKMYKNAHRQDWVDGACFLIRKEVYKQVGGFDENIFMYTEEVELSYRIVQKGWEIWYLPITTIMHIGSSSTKSKEVIQFPGISFGKENSILSEIKGLHYFYQKHYPHWQFPVMRLFLKIGAILRIFLFGFIGGQKEARRVYAKVFSMA